MAIRRRAMGSQIKALKVHFARRNSMGKTIDNSIGRWGKNISERGQWLRLEMLAAKSDYLNLISRSHTR